MKSAEDIIEKYGFYQGTEFDYFDVVKLMQEFASDREAKYKELYEAQKELIIERDKPFANKYHGRAGELINKITSLEQELGLNKE